jgi:DNA-directed RNA polymerase subunit H (RpoH/RPB5)
MDILPKAVEILLEMLEDRGEDVGALRETIVGRTDFNFLSQSIFDEWKTEKTQIIFALTKTFFTNYMKNYIKAPEINLYELYERPHILFITNEAPTPSTLTLFHIKEKQHQSQTPEHAVLQWFCLKELQYNPTKHVLVPKHERLSDEDVKLVLEKYLVKSKIHLHHIQKADKIAKWLGLRTGDVVKITRYNENSGIYYNYRCCV